MRRGIALAVAGLIVVALAVAPASQAKKKSIRGTIFVSVPGFDVNGLSTATGVVSAKKGCAGPRTVRLGIFNSDGSLAAAPQPIVVSGPTGSFIAPIARPARPFTADPAQPYTFTIKVAVDGVRLKKKGKKVNCLPIVGNDIAIQIPGEAP